VILVRGQGVMHDGDENLSSQARIFLEADFQRLDCGESLAAPAAARPEGMKNKARERDFSY
jgi:hypothetical protein